jgi:hypothetical protein
VGTIIESLLGKLRILDAPLCGGFRETLAQSSRFPFLQGAGEMLPAPFAIDRNVPTLPRSARPGYYLPAVPQIALADSVATKQSDEPHRTVVPDHITRTLFFGTTI